MAQIEIPLSEEQMAALAELARKRRVSVAELVQEGVANLLRTAEARDGAEQMGIGQVFCFDRHFREAGFRDIASAERLLNASGGLCNRSGVG